MSLGLTRDSILGLSDLVHNDDDPVVPKVEKYHDDDFLFVDEDGKASSSSWSQTMNNKAQLGVVSADQQHNSAFSSVPLAPPVDDTGSAMETMSASSSDDDLVKSRNTKPTNYAGFAQDYSEYSNYYSDAAAYDDPYAPTFEEFGVRKTSQSNFFCCIIAPWLSRNDVDQHMNDAANAMRSSGEKNLQSEERSLPDTVSSNDAMMNETDNKSSPSVNGGKIQSNQISVTSSQDEDDCSSDTDAYGEKLTDKDRLAVLARLRLSQLNPSESADTNAVSAKRESNGLLDGIPSSSVQPDTVEAKKGDTPGKPAQGTKSQAVPLSAPTISKTDGTEAALKNVQKKGILKWAGVKKQVLGREAGMVKSGSSSVNARSRRSLFPSYDPKSERSVNADSSMENSFQSSNKIRFAPMARVVTVTSRKNMTIMEKSSVWWQKSDYDDFKKSGRIIAKAMLQGGSEIWLTTNNAWSNKRQKHESQLQRAESTGTGIKVNQEAGEKPSQDEDFGHKWWCKFGHSRRGLEHIASVEEGRQRQRNVNTSISVVIEEQRRQRLNHAKDAKKLSMVAQQYTGWARDLALAAGAADAEAVRSNFGRDAKCRAHYFLTNASESSLGNAGEGTDGRIPSFMKSRSQPISPELLDANTFSTFNSKKQQKKNMLHPKDTKADQRKGPNNEQTRSAQVGNNHVRNEKGEESESKSTLDVANSDTVEAIHDPDLCSESIAKKAAGFGLGEGAPDMAAVLSGMGAVSNNNTARCSQQRTGVQAH